MKNKQNNHSPPSKRKTQIAKLREKINFRLQQRNTEKRSRDIGKWVKRLEKLERSRSLGTKDYLRNEIKKIEQRITTAPMWDSPVGLSRDYWEKEKTKKLSELRKLEAKQKKSQRLKKLLSEGFFPGQKKPGVKPRWSLEEKKRRLGYQKYIRGVQREREDDLKGWFREVFGEGKWYKKWLTTKRRREKYKGKSGWFSKWTKRIEKNLIRAEKSLERSKKKEELQNLSKISGEKIKKRSASQGWNRWVETETKRLEKALENRKKFEEEKEIKAMIEKERKKELADTWTIYDRATKKKKDKEQWYWGLYRVINDYTTEIGVWKEGYRYVLSFDKVPLSGVVIDYDSTTVWAERIW
jgi:hypothetical protein